MAELCIFCLQVTFNIETLRALKDTRHDGIGFTWNLGKASRIRSSNCPLCRFVSFALYESARISLSSTGPNTEIFLSWMTLGGGYFTLNCPGALEIYFIGNSSTNYQDDRSFRLLPNLGQALDMGRIRRWLNICTTNHDGGCRAAAYDPCDNGVHQNYAGLDMLRLIDVQRECVIETRVVRRYVALSYVWGFVTHFRVTSSNIADMMEPHSLKHNWGLLPRTIQDAITFVRGIGECYLWCDALCLLQNDRDDMAKGVNAMDLIYEKALLTIVAACGHDANSGLPGVEEGSRFIPRYPEEIVPGVQLGIYIHLEAAMKYTVYNSRAWT